MFIYTAKLTRTKLALMVGGAFAVLLAIILAVCGIRGSRTADTLGAQGKVSFTGIRDNADRVELLNSLGWEVTSDPTAIEEVIIPEEFDELYNQYNTLQVEQGLDLTRYRGKTVKRYTYGVTNYPDSSQQVSANLLIYKNRVIGGDICSAEFRGFMHGLYAE